MAPSQRSRSQALNHQLSSAEVAQGVSALAQLDDDRQARRESVSGVRIDDSDEECDSPSPIYHSFLRDDASSVSKLTNFRPVEFERLWTYVRGYLRDHWNVGRGRKCTQRPKDVLFMFLTSLKHCGKWDVVASVFKIKSPTFQKMITSFASVVSSFLYEKFVVSAAEKYTMETLVLGGNTFRNNPCARYATDVAFQHTNMPSGQMKERSAYYSAKHHLHGYKVEVSVLPNGLAINCTIIRATKPTLRFFAAMQSSICSIFSRATRRRSLQTTAHCSISTRRPGRCLRTKVIRALPKTSVQITPFKKPRMGNLTIEQVNTNDRIAHDRVIVENFFGRLCMLWAVCSDKYRWDENHYDTLFRVCVALTNYHVRLLPLRSEDGLNYHNYLKRLHVIGNEARVKRLAVQRRYREKRKLRLRRMLAAQIGRPSGGLQDESSEESEDFLSHESTAFH